MEIAILVVAVILNIVLIVALFLFTVAMALDMFGLYVTRVPFVPLAQEFVKDTVELAPRSTGVFYDLGSGNGQIVAAVARAYPNMRAVGIEKAPFPTIVTALRRHQYPKNASFLRKDFNEVSLEDADYVFMYLFPKIARDLTQKLTRELKPGSRVVCCDFPLDRTPTRTYKSLRKGINHTFYVYDF